MDSSCGGLCKRASCSRNSSTLHDSQRAVWVVHLSCKCEVLSDAALEAYPSQVAKTNKGRMFAGCLPTYLGPEPKLLSGGTAMDLQFLRQLDIGDTSSVWLGLVDSQPAAIKVPEEVRFSNEYGHAKGEQMFQVLIQELQNECRILTEDLAGLQGTVVPRVIASGTASWEEGLPVLALELLHALPWPDPWIDDREEAAVWSHLQVGRHSKSPSVFIHSHSQLAPWLDAGGCALK